MFTTSPLTKWLQKLCSTVLSLALIASLLPVYSAQAANGDLRVTYNLPAGQSITSSQFSHKVLLNGSEVASANGDGTINGLPSTASTGGNYTLQVTPLAGFVVQNNPNPIPFTMVDDQVTNITVNIGIDTNNPPSTNGSLNVTYNLPAGQNITSSQFLHKVLLNGSEVAQANGDGQIDNLQSTASSGGNYTLQVTPVTGFIVGNNPHPIPMTISGGQTTNVVVDILIDPANPPSTNGNLTVTYNLPAGQNLTSSQFLHKVLLNGAEAAQANGDGTINNLPANNYTLQVTPVTGFIVGNNPHPIPVTISGGQTTTVVVDILVDTNNPPSASGNLTVTYNLPAGQNLQSSQFLHKVLLNGAEVAQANGDGTINNLPNNAYTLQVTPVQGFIVGNNPHPIPVTISGGQTATVVVDILVDPANPPGGPRGDLTVQYNLPSGQNLQSSQFLHQVLMNGSQVAQANGDGTINNLAAGNFTLQVTSVPGFAVQNTPHPIPFTIIAGDNTTVVVNIVPSPAPPTVGAIAVQFTAPIGTNVSGISHSLNTNPVQTKTGNTVYDNLTPGALNLTVNTSTLPGGLQIRGGNNVFPANVAAGQTTSITIVLEPVQAPTTGDIAVQFTAPNGVNVAGISHTLTRNGGGFTDTKTGNAVYSALSPTGYSLDVSTASIPNGFQVRGGVNTFAATVTAGQTTTINVFIDPVAPPSTGDVAVTFTAPNGVNVATIAHTLTRDSGGFTDTKTGNSVYSALNVAAYTLTVSTATIPNGFQIRNNVNTFAATVTAGQTTTINVVIEPVAPPTSGDIAVQFTAPNNVSVVNISHTLNQNAGPFTDTKTGNDVFTGLAPGAYTLTVDNSTIPNGFRIQGGSNTFTATVVAGQTATITVVIEAIPAATTGSLAVVFTAPAGVVTTGISHTLVETGGTFNSTQTGDFTHNNLNPTAHVLTVATNTLPAGHEIQGGTNIFNATVVAGNTVTITVTIVPVNTTGNVAVTFTAPAGVNTAVIQHTLSQNGGGFSDTRTGNFTYSTLNPAAYTLAVNVGTIPAGFRIQGGTNSFAATVTAGQTATINITIEAIPAGQNNAPAIAFAVNNNAVTSVNAVVGTPVTVVVTGTDADAADTLTLTLTTNPIAASTTFNAPAPAVSPVTGNLVINAVAANVGSHTLTFTIQDGQGGNTTANLQVVIAPAPVAPAITVTPTNVQISEAGQTAQFTVVLTTVPTGVVTVRMTSTNPFEGFVDPTNNSFAIFNPSNALTPQTFTVTPNNDLLKDGNITFQIDLQPAVSTDLNYNGIDPANVTVTSLDDNDTIMPGGGGSRRRVSKPTEITFSFNGSEVTEISTAVGTALSVKVKASKLSPPLANEEVQLRLKTNPTSNHSSPARFKLDEKQANPGREVTGVLTWLPSNEDIRTTEFEFGSSINNSFENVTTLKITVNKANLVAGGGIGPLGIGPSNTVPKKTDPFEKCRYSDNETESVIYLCMLGIIDAPTEGRDYNGQLKQKRFFGNDFITRGAFTKMMINITYDQLTIDRVAKLIVRNNFYSFPDVEPSAWFSKYIAVGKMDHHLDGYNDGEFIPWRDIEISEAAKILFNTSRGDNPKIRNDLAKAKAQVGADGAWFMPFAILAREYGGFMPKLDRDPGLIYSKRLTRQQAADMIYATIKNAGLDAKSKLSDLQKEMDGMEEFTGFDQQEEEEKAKEIFTPKTKEQRILERKQRQDKMRGTSRSEENQKAKAIFTPEARKIEALFDSTTNTRGKPTVRF